MRRALTFVWVLALALSVTCMCGAKESEGTSGIHPYPLFPSEPIPGWPGVNADTNHTIEKLSNLDNVQDPRPATWGIPEFLSYPGAVHHIRNHVQRYIPSYPLYNQNTLLKNFVMNEIAEFKNECVDFAEPVYFSGMYGGRMTTTQRRTPVKAYPWKPGSPKMQMELGKLGEGLYVMRPVIACINDPADKAVGHAKGVVMLKMRVNDWPDDKERMNAYIMRATVMDNFYASQHFYFHSRGDGRDFNVEFELLDDGELGLRLYNIDLHDHFAETAQRRGKTRRVLDQDVTLDRQKLEANWATNRVHAKLKGTYERLLQTNPNKTPEEQVAWDDNLWNRNLPLNGHSIGWVFYLRFNKEWQERWRLCPVPEEWDYYREKFGADTNSWVHSWFLDLTNGVYYVSKGGRYETYRDSPPSFEVRGLNVYEKGKDGKLLGPLSDYTYDANQWQQPVNLLKDGKVVREWKDCELRDGTIYKDGKLYSKANVYREGKQLKRVGKKIVAESVCPAYPRHRYYDARLRDAFLREVKIKPGVYYDAARYGKGLGVGIDQHRGYKSLKPWTDFGHRQTMRDHAMKLIRGLYDVPAVRATHRLAYLYGMHGLDEGLIKNGSAQNFYYSPRIYDAMYDFLATDEEFAQSVSRYLPWIKTPDDVIKFVDTYLMQDMANRMMKYLFYTDHEQAQYLMEMVLVQDDRSITDEWMEFLFTRGWEYPQAVSGLGDNLVTGSDRDGGTTIGSFCYTLGGATKTMGMLEKYIQNGGNEKYDVSDARQYPGVRQKPYLAIEGSAAGEVNPGVGDVGGPAEHYGRFGSSRALTAAGWRWHKDPKFAWLLANRFGRSTTTDVEWAEIQEAAKECPQNPFTMNKSRVLSAWGSYLTGGACSKDHRFIREATVRLGTGYGHHHHDTLDLRLFAFGCTMASDFNQRFAYGRPPHRYTFLHNVVQVDQGEWMSHAWARNLFDAPSSPYTCVESIAPEHLEHVTLFRRQMALVDVDAGRDTEDRKGKNVALPSSYLFDVFRASGGTNYTYCFHGCLDDGFEVNAKNRKPATNEEDSPDNGYLGLFGVMMQSEADTNSVLSEPMPYWAGECDGNDLVATWRLERKAELNMLRHRRADVEGEPRKYTRLTLLDQKDSKIMHAFARDKKCTSQYGRCLYAQRQYDTPTDNVFVALIEPYAGEPSITGQKLLKITNNDEDARKAVAVEVKTHNGHTDLLFADGRPEKRRVISNQSSVISGKDGSQLLIAGEYAYLSYKRGKLRQATITGGKLLDASEIKIEVETPRYEGEVKKVDYLTRKVTVKGNIPARLAGHFFEIGGDYHKTSYEVESIKSGRSKSVLTMRKGLEITRTRVREVDPETGKVVGAIAMFRHRGRDRGLVASDDSLKKFWRAAYTGGNRHTGHVFNLTPMDPKKQADKPAFKAKDFPSGAGLRVWEFGVGDTFGIQTGVSIRRTHLEGSKIVYELYATSPFKLTIKGKSAAWSSDGKEWKALAAKEQKGNLTISFDGDHLGGGNRIYLRADSAAAFVDRPKVKIKRLEKGKGLQF